MSCLSVCGDNPQALACGLSYVQVDKHGLTILYHLLAHHEIFYAKVGKGGIISRNTVQVRTKFLLCTFEKKISADKNFPACNVSEM